jgi:hypothetical protein
MALCLLRAEEEAHVNTAIEVNYWRDVVGAAYDGLPTLSVTLAQARRLWAIEEEIARRVLDSYLETGYLTMTPDGRYRRADHASSGAAARRRSAGGRA